MQDFLIKLAKEKIIISNFPQKKDHMPPEPQKTAQAATLSKIRFKAVDIVLLL